MEKVVKSRCEKVNQNLGKRDRRYNPIWANGMDIHSLLPSSLTINTTGAFKTPVTAHKNSHNSLHDHNLNISRNLTWGNFPIFRIVVHHMVQYFTTYGPSLQLSIKNKIRFTTLEWLTLLTCTKQLNYHTWIHFHIRKCNYSSLCGRQDTDHPLSTLYPPY